MWSGARGGAWKKSSHSLGRSALKRPVPWSPRLRPGGERSPGVAEPPTHATGNSPVGKTQPQDQATKADRPAQFTAQKGRPRWAEGGRARLLPGNASRGSGCVLTAGEHRGGIGPHSCCRALLASGSHTHRGRSHPSGPSLPGWETPRIRGRCGHSKAPRLLQHLVHAATPQHAHNRQTWNVTPDMLLKKERTEEEDRSYTALNTACDALHVLGGDGRAGTEVGRAPADWWLPFLRGQSSSLPISAATVHDSKGEVAGC